MEHMYISLFESDIWQRTIAKRITRTHNNNNIIIINEYLIVTVLPCIALFLSNVVPPLSLF